MTIITESDSLSLISSSSNIVFIDANIDNYQSLISSIDNTELMILDSTRDGVEQITEVLANYSEVDSIHIISHGQSGRLQLGSTEVNTDNLNSYGTNLQRWSNSLVGHGDILLYGCSVGEGITGNDFIANFSQLTNADIAASDDLTGSSHLGGDWDLEITTGKIEADIITNSEQNYYNSVLAIGDGNQEVIINYNNFADVDQLTLNGNAAQANDSLRLTTTENRQQGTAFYQQALAIDSSTSFTTQFQFQVSGGTDGADGFTFVLQNDSRELAALGGHGGALGYQGIEQS
ncbi:MAG: DUF4347 domain-containing protein, partial [Cyanobacteria bacterium P01_A01_bin.40]